MDRSHWAALRLIVLYGGLLAVAAGCGERRSAAPVSGTVTVSGKPLEGIRVSFQPVGPGLGSAGTTDAAGNFTLRFVDNDLPGAQLGQHKVTFYDVASASTEDSPDGGKMPAVKTRLPRRFLSEALEFEVKPGENRADFDLR
jgi:hypothetical protein